MLSQHLAEHRPLSQYAASSPAQNVSFALPVTIYGTFQHDWRMAELSTWNLNLEHQFGQSWVARISYAGNKGTYLTSQLNYSEQNPTIYQPGNSTEANIATIRPVCHTQAALLGLGYAESSS